MRRPARIAKMELNENNLKISTIKKNAEGLDCDFVYGFVPKSSLQETVNRQARKKAEAILSNVNTNMALEEFGGKAVLLFFITE